MKIVHFVTHEHGGAYVAAKRLTDIYSVQLITKNYSYYLRLLNKIGILVDKFFYFFLKEEFKNSRVFSSFLFIPNFFVPKVIKDAEVLHLHWTGDFIFLSKEILRTKLIFIHLHDTFFLTGGCHYTNGCIKFLNSCSNCPLFDSHILKYSVTKFKKEKFIFFKNNNINFIAPSNWIFNLAKSCGFNTFHLPNIHPIKQYFDAKRFSGKYKVLLGSASNVKDTRKNIYPVLEFLMKFDLEIHFIGKANLADVNNFSSSAKIIYHGYLSCSEEINNIYNLVDIFILPSLEENYSNMLLESLYTGTPVAALDIGGNRDIIKDGINGYLKNNLFELLKFIVLDSNNPLKYSNNFRFYYDSLKENKTFVLNKLINIYDHNNYTYTK